MKVSVEEINGKLCTTVRRTFDAGWVREQLNMGIPVAFNYISSRNTHYILPATPLFEYLEKHHTAEFIVVTLPALPRHPKPEDASLLYRYMAEMIYPIAKLINPTKGRCTNCESPYYEHTGSHGVCTNRACISYGEKRASVSYTLFDALQGLLWPDAEIKITHALLNNERVEIAIRD